jgi:hypothetical protein
MRNRSQWALRLLTLAATVAMAVPVLAQNSPLGQKPNAPSAPFQEKGAAPIPGGPGLVTPQSLTDDLEAWAQEREAKQWGPLERTRYYRILQPRDLAEFNALGRYAVLVLTVITQRADELPLKRVYLRMPDREIPVLKIASWRRDVDQTLVTYKIYGPYREDGFYLFPLGAYLRVAQLQADFAANRSGLPLLELPYNLGPDWLKTVQNPDPLPSALPNLRALQELIKRKTSGFPIPTSLPQVVPEARRPTPEPAAQPDEARKPTALKDLFKK